MFLKVFKYDFKAIFFKFIPVLAVLPVLAILVRIVNLLDATNVFAGMVIVLFNGLFALSCCLLTIYTIVICIMRYVKSLFRDQGYLTHTLPVSKHHLLLSQLLADFLMELISIALIFICLFIAYFTPEIFSLIAQVLSEMFEIVISSEDLGSFAGTLILLVFAIFFQAIQSIFIIYTGVALGHSFPKNKGILSVVFCIAINYGINIINFILMIMVSILDFAVINVEQVFSYVNITLIITIVESFALSVVAYFLDIYLMKNKLCLE
ncbi:MAG: hypothetical protein K2N64_05555 [Anaeroplasmataceae bacterium]|nr:hypothetical protein [Anaeroplasmataceae bacterium]